MAGYVAMVGMCRWARGVMLKGGFGKMQIGDVGPYFQTPKFVTGRTVAYASDGQKRTVVHNTLLNLIDGEWGFQLKLIEGNSTRATIVGTNVMPSDHLDYILRHPDSIAAVAAEEAHNYFAANRTRRRLYPPDSVVPPWWCEDVERQGSEGIGILRQVTAALADTEFNTDPSCALVAARLQLELGFGVAA